MRSKQGCVPAEISLVMIFCSVYLNLKNVILDLLILHL